MMNKTHLRLAVVFAATLVATACTSKQVAMLPPVQANAPAIPAPQPVAPRPAEISQVATVTEPEVHVTPAADPVADLIAEVEKHYQSGQTNFKSGHLDAAKSDFNLALQLLLKGPDSKSDARLQHELELVQEALKGLNAEDQKQAEASPEQLPEPAPIDEANDLAPASDETTKAKAEAEIKATHSDLPLIMTDQVAGYIAYFSGRGRDTFENALVRSGRYREMIQRTLKEEGVPQDLIYLAQAESGFHPLALSRVGARGMWQFMSSRAKGYGLERTKWVDDRQDPEKATRAAARHLKDLYNQFGDWWLAMAAYNSGPGGVQGAVKRTGYADFWQLYQRNALPKETRNYVPIILATTIMTKNPAQYGLDKLVLDKAVSYDTVKLDYPVDLRLVAQCVDTTTSDLQDLNPSLLRWTTPETGQFELRLPAGSKDKYLQAVAMIPKDKRVWWRYHEVVAGDTLSSIARSYRTTPASIAQANQIETDAVLSADSHLVIPIAPGKHAVSEDSQTYARRITRYRVRKGDTVQTVADNFNVPATMVRRWNHLRGDSLRGRRVLYVHLPVSPGSRDALRASTPKAKSKKTLRPVSSVAPKRHTVKPGETLFSIASEHHTTVAALQRDNGALAVIKPGMVLIVRDAQ